jgi:NAD(P)H-hydrate epimerase
MVYPGAGYVGDLTLADIGIPRRMLDADDLLVALTTPEDVRALVPARAPDAHKGDFGRVLILAGSPGFTGAAILAGRAAMRAGSGLVTVGTPASLNPILETGLLEAMTVPLPETPEQTLAPAALEPILNFLARSDAVAIGPGLSQHDQTAALLRDLLPQLNKPTVLDADALNILAREDFPFPEVPAPLVLTPHPGEMSRLLQRPTADLQADRLAAAREAAARFKAVVVLKGARTVIADPSGRIVINPTGNPGLASGGTGDVLTGILASLLGQGLSAFEAAVVATYLHGLAGDLATAEGSPAALIAGDLLEWLPRAWREMGG